MDESSSKTEVEKIRKRLWWLPCVWVEWDAEGDRWVMVKWKFEW